MKKAMAIHDISGFGKCSLTVALPVLSACGIETIVLPTAVLSTHTAIPGFTYRDLTEDIPAFYKHWEKLNLKFDSVYSGFLGSNYQIDMVKDIIKTFKTNNNLILVDPVMADYGKMYTIFDEAFAKDMAKLCSCADIIVPNITEACFMLGASYKEGPYEKAYIEMLLKDLSSALNIENVILTGVYFDDKKLGASAYSKKENVVCYGFSEKVEGSFHGTGDLYASVMLASLLNGKKLNEAIKIAADFVTDSIKRTLNDGIENFNYGVNFEEGLADLYLKIKSC